MMVFDPLWETMKKKGITIYALVEKHDIGRSTIHKLRHDRNVTLVTIEKLCRILDCQPGEIVLYVKEE